MRARWGGTRSLAGVGHCVIGREGSGEIAHNMGRVEG